MKKRSKIDKISYSGTFVDLDRALAYQGFIRLSPINKQ
jgi:hypothetical protein